uniref:ATP-binding protein n=2 Tax=Flavobacterium sp. TaxID=239 RepID=UPI0040498B17
MKQAFLLFHFFIIMHFAFGNQITSHKLSNDYSISLNNFSSNVEKSYLFVQSNKSGSDLITKNTSKNDGNKELPSSKFSKLISILTILLITILSLLSLSLYKNNIIRTESNEQLVEKNKELIEAKIKAEDALRARQEFISTVSHELRTPLNAIHGLTHILLNESPNESQKKYLEPLKFSSEYLKNFIDDILEINRIEKEKIEINLKNTEIREVVNNIFYSFKDIIPNNQTKLELVVDPEIPEFLKIDTIKLSQIINNLINNAIKFTENGAVKLELKLVESIENIYAILFKISDTGIGISKENQTIIFENFTQGSTEINRKYGGTGIGLAIVKKLVKVLGGEIKVDSELQVGTTFSFILMLEKGEPKSQIKTPVFKIDSNILVNKRILLVEDNKINQIITKKIIETKQMITDIAENGEDAVMMAKSGSYDLILMDVHLPGINGTEATELIREFNTEIPIIGLTAISLNENRENLISFGMNDVITKPFDVEHFYFTIANYLKK